MSKLLCEIKKKNLFFIILVATLIIGLVWLLIAGKAASFIALNSYHPFWLNVMFINYTFIGDGIFAIGLSALYFMRFRKIQTGWMLLYSFLLSGIIVQVIKNLFHSQWPKLFFEPGQYLFFIDGVKLSNDSSFPSGHTATAFAIATILVLIMKETRWQLFILVAAFGVGYSRIYLAQHFLADIIAGAVIGTLSSVIVYALVINKVGVKIANRVKPVYNAKANIAYP